MVPVCGVFSRRFFRWNRWNKSWIAGFFPDEWAHGAHSVSAKTSRTTSNRKVDKMNTFSKIAGATALAATMLTGTLGSSWAGAVPTDVGTVKSTQDADVVPVRWGHRGWWGPGAIIGGVAAGLAGAAVAEGVYGPYAYGPYPYGAYDYDYYPGPYYYGPHWRYHHHW
jgi:hypothetical protein